MGDGAHVCVLFTIDEGERGERRCKSMSSNLRSSHTKRSESLGAAAVQVEEQHSKEREEHQARSRPLAHSNYQEDLPRRRN